MIKIIFSDFDRTMLDDYSDDNYFDDYRISILNKLKDKGIKFCIVTGRNVSFFERFPNLLEVVDYVIGSNGACVYDVYNKEYIYQDIIEEKILNEMIDYAIMNNFYFLLNCFDKRYQYGSFNNRNAIDYEKGKNYNCEQFVLFSKKESSEGVVSFLDKLGGVKVNNCDFGREGYFFDINNVNVSKGNSVSWLCDRLNIDKEDTIGFGDGVNDISMFQVVGKSIAVGNADDDLKKVASEVIFDCKENGIYKYIEENVLK